ncbi:MAG TPA: WGxxGxxG family protein [Longimicrobiaceae bacterium]|nr:WGxxGxxG family protein [Longimicrobiaceae bacterium]
MTARARRRRWLVMLLGLGMLSPLAVRAQDTPTTVIEEDVDDDDDGGDFPWGLLGLLGLAGLLPRRQRDVHVHETRTPPPPPPRDDFREPPPAAPPPPRV